MTCYPAACYTPIYHEYFNVHVSSLSLDLSSLLFWFLEPLPGIPSVVKERLLSMFSVEKGSSR